MCVRVCGVCVRVCESLRACGSGRRYCSRMPKSFLLKRNLTSTDLQSLEDEDLVHDINLHPPFITGALTFLDYHFNLLGLFWTHFHPIFPFVAYLSLHLIRNRFIEMYKKTSILVRRDLRTFWVIGCTGCVFSVL